MTFEEALIAARPLIESGGHKYICTALSAVGAAEHRERITKLLGLYNTYEKWVYRTNNEVYWKMCMTPRTFRQGRLQWLDYLISRDEKRKSKSK